MSDLFPVFEGIKFIQYNPSQYSFALGEQCIECRKKLIYHQSITPCLCYLYAHQKCLIKKQMEIRCRVCEKQISLSYQRDLDCGIKCFFGCILGILICTFYWLYIGKAIGTIVLTIVIGLLLSFFIVGSVIFFINLVLRKIVTISRIKSTGLQLKISAFQNLQQFSQQIQQQTQAEMIIKKVKK